MARSPQILLRPGAELYGRIGQAAASRGITRQALLYGILDAALPKPAGRPTLKAWRDVQIPGFPAHLTDAPDSAQDSPQGDATAPAALIMPAAVLGASWGAWVALWFVVAAVAIAVASVIVARRAERSVAELVADDPAPSPAPTLTDAEADRLLIALGQPTTPATRTWPMPCVARTSMSVRLWHNLRGSFADWNDPACPDCNWPAGHHRSHADVCPVIRQNLTGDACAECGCPPGCHRNAPKVVPL